MQQYKRTRNAFISSIIGMVACTAMLFGATLAWFSDTTSTNVKTIEVGDLGIELQYEVSSGEFESVKGKTIDFVKMNGEQIAEDKKGKIWSPGAEYKLPDLQIENTGKLAAKYEIAISGIHDNDPETVELVDLLEVSVSKKPQTVGGEPMTLAQYMESSTIITGEIVPGGKAQLPTISLKMKDHVTTYDVEGEASEDSTQGQIDYQNMKLEGLSITVVATQLPEEFDSETNKYDEKAQLPDIWDGSATPLDELLPNDSSKEIKIDSAEDLAGLAMAVTPPAASESSPASEEEAEEPADPEDFDGYKFVLTTDINLAELKWTPIGTDASHPFKGTFDGNGHVISGLNIGTADKTESGYMGLFGYVVGGEIKNLTVEGYVAGTTVGGIVAYMADSDVSDCISNVTIKASSYAGGIVGHVGSSTSGHTAEIKDCTSNGSISGGTSNDGTVGYGEGKFELENCEAADVEE